MQFSSSFYCLRLLFWQIDWALLGPFSCSCSCSCSCYCYCYCYCYIYIYIYISIAFAVVCGVRSLFVCLSLLVSSFVRLFAKHLYLSARSAKRSYYDDMEMIVICLSGTVCVVVDPKNRPKWILNIKTKSCPNFNSIY